MTHTEQQPQDAPAARGQVAVEIDIDIERDEARLAAVPIEQEMSEHTEHEENDQGSGPRGANAAGDGPCGDQPLTHRIEALLMSTDRPLQDSRLCDLIGIPSKGGAVVIKAAVDELNEQYNESGRTFRIERVARGWQVLTCDEFGPLLLRLHADRQQSKLSPAALETLSIIAYRQPIMRAEIEAIRGVASGEVLRGLMERRLVKVAGRAEELGRPMLYGTTAEFLNVFGLAGLDDLPVVEGLKREPSYRPPKPVPEDSSEANAGPMNPAENGPGESDSAESPPADAESSQAGHSVES